jgi:hypothetical protein
VAARKAVVENAAAEFVTGVKVRTALENLAVGWLRATSIVKGFADAIVWLLVANVVEEGRVNYVSISRSDDRG